MNKLLLTKKLITIGIMAGCASIYTSTFASTTPYQVTIYNNGPKKVALCIDASNHILKDGCTGNHVAINYRIKPGSSIKLLNPPLTGLIENTAIPTSCYDYAWSDNQTIYTHKSGSTIQVFGNC